MISLNSDGSEDDQSRESISWEQDDQVLDLLPGTEDSEQEDEEEQEEDWGSRKNAFYDADQDSGKCCKLSIRCRRRRERRSSTNTKEDALKNSRIRF
jgi:hypothetical protein